MKPITWKDRAKALMKANRELGKQNTRLLRLLEESESRKNWAYSELLKANQEIIRIERERRESDSIYTVSKRETELERQLESEHMRADELSEHLKTLRNQYREMYNDCHIFINENSSLKKELEKFEKMKQEDANS